ncbi:MAG: glycosyltransferase family A protein [Leeuwenhoekiella sp.]
MEGISVIIPTYNRETYIGKAIESILIQDYQGQVEIIISDDGSRDKTLAIAGSYDKDGIIILKKPRACTSQGASGARNRGLEVASQPLICFLDSDDFYLPGHLKKMQKMLKSNSSLDFVLCRALQMDETRSKSLYRPWTKNLVEPVDLLNLSVSSNYFAHTNVFMFKKYIFDNVGRFNENIKVGEDSDMWIRINELYNCDFSDHFGAVIRKHGMEQLTDLPKKSLLKGHYYVFSTALKRYYKLNRKDAFRFKKLLVLSTKYKLSQWPFFSLLYMLAYKANVKKQANLDDWHPLSFYLR